MRLQVLRGYEGERVDTKEYNNRERHKLRLLVYLLAVKNSAFHQEFHQQERKAKDQTISLTENYM
jgi:hypothetical protein